MTWAQRLKRVFHIDIDKSAGKPICTVADCREAVGHMDVPDKTCRACGGAIKVIACIEDPQVIEKILTDLDQKPAATARNPLPRSRAPPPPGLFGRH